MRQAEAERRRHCDVCGADGPLDRVHLSGLDAVLCCEHAERLGRQLAEHVALMRAQQADHLLLQGRRLRDGEALDVIRSWARDHGYPVSARGSVSPRILEAYRQASGHGDAQH